MWLDMGSEPTTIIGHHVLAIHPKALEMAVEHLASIGSATRHLKVRSGEHIAALLLTAILGRPTDVDTSGGVDLLFSRASSAKYTELWPFASKERAAFEIKSLAGGFRHAESRMKIGDHHTVTVRTVADVLSDAGSQITAACDSLAKKCDSTTSRNVFLLVHLFDAVVIEAFAEPGPIMGHLLTPLSSEIQVDTLWVLWHPDILTMWSQQERTWTDVLFDTADETAESPPDRALSYLQRAESDFLGAIGYSRGSPWLFGIQTK